MTEVVLVRHGETELNRLGAFRGRAEAALNDRGRMQAKWVADALKEVPIVAVLSSPLGRAVETAGEIAAEHGIVPAVDEAFNNIDLGEWQGVEKEFVKREYPDAWKMWTTDPERLVIPGGETLSEVRDRVYPRLMELVEEYQGRRICVVSHRSVLKVLSAKLLGLTDGYYWRFYLDNAAYSLFGYERDAGYTLIKWNENCHIRDKVVEEF